MKDADLFRQYAKEAMRRSSSNLPARMRSGTNQPRLQVCASGFDE